MKHRYQKLCSATRSTCLEVVCDLLFKYFAIHHFSADLFKLFEPLIGKKSIQYANGPEGRKRRQLMDRSFSHEAVKDYYEHFVKVHGFISRFWSHTGVQDERSLVLAVKYV